MSRNFGRVIAGKEFFKPRKWEQWSEGDFIQGEFVGELDKDKFGKPLYGIKVDGIADAQVVVKDDTIPMGKKDGIVPLYPNGGLIMQMAHASVGDFVKITYGGKVKIKKGTWAGSMAHSINVEIDGYQTPDAEGDDSLLGG